MTVRIAIVLAGLLSLGATASGQPDVTVREERGTYSVAARFDVPQSPAAVIAVLTDYEKIPRFMPGVEMSVVRERNESGAVVEQQAISRVLMFTKRVHLVLEVEETATTLAFRDRCGRSFRRYAGSWRVVPAEGGTTVIYELEAAPSFEVPEFLLKRLLKRDSREMIARLRAEIDARP